MKIYKCKICGREIHKVSFLYRSGLCKSCSHKGKPSGRLGKKHTQATRNKISKAKKGKFKGKNNPFWGKKHTETTREKMRIAQGKRWKNPKEKAKVSGKNNYNYINGLGNFPYPPEFTNTLKNEIRQRDNYECQNCGMTQEENFKRYNKQLEIHHIDHCPDNCDKSNLITLCKKCNMIENKDIDYWYAYYTYKMEEKTNA
jgi:DNA-directed RNA polymerase subunit RPC12/RpoP